ncbi:MAG: N-acetyltransferase [Firmicutes bacterium]|nr:N-acetyltransferase [Bacillota bacterium]
MITEEKNMVLIRKATCWDLPKILSLYQLLDTAYDHEPASKVAEDVVWEKLMQDPRQHLLVAEVAGGVLGTLTVIIIPNIGHDGCPWAAIENFVVEEACRGTGIGKKLMDAATKLCQDYGCYKIVLSSNLARQQSHEFYRHLGWQQSHIGFSIAMPQEPVDSCNGKSKQGKKQ